MQVIVGNETIYIYLVTRTKSETVWGVEIRISGYWNGSKWGEFFDVTCNVQRFWKSFRRYQFQYSHWVSKCEEFIDDRL